MKEQIANFATSENAIWYAYGASGLLVVTMMLIVYLLTSRQGKKALAEVNQMLAANETEKNSLQGQLSKITEENAELTVSVRTLQLEKQAAQTHSGNLVERKQELENELANLKELQLKTQEYQHKAERALGSTQAELSSANKQQLELEQRIEGLSKDLAVERESVKRVVAEASSNAQQAKAFEVAEKEAREQLLVKNQELHRMTEALEEQRVQNEGLANELTEISATQQEREASHAREVANFEQQKKSLSEQFKVLSTEILEANTKSLRESSKLTLSSIMNPFQQSIDSFKKEVQDIHHRESTQRGELKKELETLKELNQKITTEAHELSTALRGQKKLQGNWGELVLENVLERSGLVQGKDYKREVSITTEEGRQRPDAVVYLPQDKHLIIDAKVSLNAYTRFVNAEDETERALALSEHVTAMGARIKELAERDYYKLPGLNSPEMVFMFVPIESAFVEALKADETLFQAAIENNVLVATPTTLLTSLNIVRQLWRYEDQNKHTAALANKAETVFKKLNTFLASFEGVKKGLDKANEAYVKAEGQLISGRGNLVKQVGEFKNLAPAIKAELPGYFTDKAALEIDFIPADEEDNAEAASSSAIEHASDQTGQESQTDSKFEINQAVTETD